MSVCCVCVCLCVWEREREKNAYELDNKTTTTTKIFAYNFHFANCFRSKKYPFQWKIFSSEKFVKLKWHHFLPSSWILWAKRDKHFLIVFWPISSRSIFLLQFLDHLFIRGKKSIAIQTVLFWYFNLDTSLTINYSKTRV